MEARGGPRAPDQAVRAHQRITAGEDEHRWLRLGELLDGGWTPRGSGLIGMAVVGLGLRPRQWWRQARAQGAE